MLSATARPVKEDLVATFGPQLSKKPEVLDRLVSFSSIFGVSADELHAKWEAYALTTAAQKSGDDLTIPTLSHLESLQNQLLRQQETDRKVAVMGTSDTLYNVRDANPFLDNTVLTADTLDDFLGQIPTPSRGRRRIIPRDATPVASNISRTPQKNMPQLPRTPGGASRYQDIPSPSASRAALGSPKTPSGRSGNFILQSGPSPNALKFADRLDKAKKEEILNEHVPAHKSSAGERVRCEVSLVPGQQTTGYRYMHERLMLKGDYLDERIEHLAEVIADDVRAKVKGTEMEDFTLQHPGMPTQESIITVGRVCCDSIADSAKLNEQSVLLEASRSMGAGVRVKVNLGEVPEISLFPGQIVGVTGINPSGRLINVSKLHPPPAPPSATSTPGDLLGLYPENDPLSANPVNVVIASGPFTLEDSLNYEPFEDFVKQMEIDAPDVIILQGPFVDSTHPMIMNGDLDISLDGLFREQISPRLRRLIKVRKDGSAKVILIPSTRDACSEWVSFPQPPLAADLSDDLAFERRQVLGIPNEILLFPNPVQFTINETVFACCSSDVLWQMCSEEIARSSRSSSDPVSNHKISRLFRHMLGQRSFYPLFPSALDDACLDLSRSGALELQATPDIFITSSRLRYSARTVDGCVCINSGFLVKGRSGGTFAKICIHPLELSRIKELAANSMDVESDEQVAIGHSVTERCRVEIQRI
ncbi:DNA polymerase alpha/epsilon subunit B-domain-containing protein [Phlyctochytrium arcticum]|nr:DNA polymerase alpha/epsilon subunit B-domain-containing protein [Phlyctochytrium arcticum]